MNVAFPYQFNTARGRTADPTEARHIRGLLEQLLFTSPGERVNLPQFGTGVLQLVFAANSPELAAAAQLLIQGAIQRWLAELILVDAIDVHSREAAVEITICYAIRRTEERRAETFTLPRP